MFNLFGVLLQFLASPDDVGDAISLFRCTVPVGVVIPLHSHPDPELLYILEGSLEIFRPNEGSSGWRTVGVGDVVAIPGNCAIVVYSDGLIDAPNSEGEEFGDERLASCCRQLPKGASAEAICTSLSQRVAEWSADAEQFDDTTILVLAVN